MWFLVACISVLFLAHPKRKWKYPGSDSSNTMSQNFLIKHCSSGLFFHPKACDHGDNTAIVLNKDIHQYMHWTFEKVTGHWGYFKHVSSGKIIHPTGQHLQPENDTHLVLHGDRHWGALFAIDTVNDHIVHRGGRYAHPICGLRYPENDTTVLLHSDVHIAMQFKCVSVSDPNTEVLIYGKPTIIGKWKIIYMAHNPAVEHVDKLEVKIGKSEAESRTTSFKYRWETSVGFDMTLVNATESVRIMMGKASSATWTKETTRTRETRVKPGNSVVTWQYVFEVQQNDSKVVFHSTLLADTDNIINEPDTLQNKALIKADTDIGHND